MKIILSSIILAVTLLTFQVISAQTSSGNVSFSEPVLKAGAAKSKITPPVGCVMGNSYELKTCEGVHDDLYARTIVFDFNGRKGAFIALDVVSIPYIIVTQTRELIAKQTGIPETNIIMSATHAHAGPQMNPLFLNAAGGAPEQKSETYLKALPAMITESVISAKAKLEPVRVSVGRSSENQINFNRRYLMKDGTFKMNPGRLNPDAIRPAGPVDPDVYAVYFDSPEGKPVALLANFALHPAIVTDNHISADFPGIVCNIMEKFLGEEMVTVYTNGTSGNINHINVNRRNQPEGYEESTRVGTIIAADLMKALALRQPVEVNSFQVHREEVRLPVPEVSENELAWAHKIMSQNGKSPAPAFNDVVRAWKLIDQAGTKDGTKRSSYTTTIPLTDDGKALKSEAGVMTFGNELALIGFPGDAFTELGMAIKQNSPYPLTVVSEQSGGTLSYVPNRKGFPEGGYEGESARFTPGGGELLVDAVIRVLTEMYPYKKK